MKYTQAQHINILKKEYDCIIGFADEFIEFEQRYSPLMYTVDLLIANTQRHKSKAVCGSQIMNLKDCIDKIKFRLDENIKICIILFSNRECYLMPELIQYFPYADFIISRLVISDSIKPRSYSRDCEDLVFFQLINKIGIDKDSAYVDIGVCHPVVRNNTFLLYENGFYNGILVEPNPDFINLIPEYRPKNTFLNVGAGVRDCKLTYISHKEGERPGWNYFTSDASDIDINQYKKMEIDVININTILAKIDCNFGVIDIDAEKMDLSLLKAIDFKKFPFQIVCVEPGKLGRLHLAEMMEVMYKNEYIHFTNTLENAIFIRKEARKFLA